MLLVIFGAGASFDSVPDEALPQSPPEMYRPPLANMLLDNRSSLGAVLDKFPQCLPLVNPLRRRAANTGFALEHELESLLAEAEDYPLRKRQFTAFRFYLQNVLWECGEKWGAAAHWSTNYVELLSRIDAWRVRRQEAVAVVTFNYDTLIEHAIEKGLGKPLATMESYVSDSEWRLFKVHGSVNWGRGALAGWDGRGDPRTFMIENVDDVTISNRFFITTPDTPPVFNERLLFPAIAVPVASKAESSFECPQEHLRALRHLLPRVTKVLAIGWRGMEQHFLDLMTAAPIQHVFTVTGDPAEADALARRLAALNAGMASRGDGFSRFLQEEVLEGWLG